MPRAADRLLLFCCLQTKKQEGRHCSWPCIKGIFSGIHRQNILPLLFPTVHLSLSSITQLCSSCGFQKQHSSRLHHAGQESKNDCVGFLSPEIKCMNTQESGGYWFQTSDIWKTCGKVELRVLFKRRHEYRRSPPNAFQVAAEQEGAVCSPCQGRQSRQRWQQQEKKRQVKPQGANPAGETSYVLAQVAWGCGASTTAGLQE